MRALLRHGGDRRALRAFAARQELVNAGLTRRDLVRMGLMTGGGVGGGLLVAEKSLAKDGRGRARSDRCRRSRRSYSRCRSCLSCRLAIRRPTPASRTRRPPRRTGQFNPATGLPFEGRSEPHQSRGPGQPGAFEPEDFHITRIGATPHATVHPGLPEQTLWGFNLGDEDLAKDPPLSPGPVLVLRHLHGALVRRYNALPPIEQNGGFGVPEVSTHLHNFHSAPDSDGGPCDPVQQRFFFRGQYYDYFHNMRCAGWNSTNTPDGDLDEYLGFMWYDDHRVDHTAENTYKGLVGPAIMFGRSTRATSRPDCTFRALRTAAASTSRSSSATGCSIRAPDCLPFDRFNTDGILGNVFLVNGKAQPFFEVNKRRYRFRLLDAGPSRFYEFFLTNPDNLSQSIPFLVISEDGNLVGRPVKTTSIRLAVAERNDIIVDFARIASEFGNPKRLILENRLEHTDGRGPSGKILPAGRGDQLLEFRIGPAVADGSFDYDPLAAPGIAALADDSVFGPIVLPDISTAVPRITRTFRFERGDGGWQVNGKFMDCTRFRFTCQMNGFERWIIRTTRADGSTRCTSTSRSSASSAATAGPWSPATWSSRARTSCSCARTIRSSC